MVFAHKLGRGHEACRTYYSMYSLDGWVICLKMSLYHGVFICPSPIFFRKKIKSEFHAETLKQIDTNQLKFVV